MFAPPPAGMARSTRGVPTPKAPAGPPGGAVIQPGKYAQAVTREEADSLYALGMPIARVWMALATDPDFAQGPQALYHLMRAARSQIGLPAGLAAPMQLENLASLGEAEGMKVVVLGGSGAAPISDEVAAALAKYIEGGGFVIVDGGNDEFRSLVMVQLAKAVRGAQRGQVHTDHALFVGKSMPYDLTGGTLVSQSDGIWVGDRLAVFASAGPLVEPWSDPTSKDAQPALELGVNLIAYALQQAK